MTKKNYVVLWMNIHGHKMHTYLHDVSMATQSPDRCEFYLNALLLGILVRIYGKGQYFPITSRCES